MVDFDSGQVRGLLWTQKDQTNCFSIWFFSTKFHDPLVKLPKERGNLLWQFKSGYPSLRKWIFPWWWILIWGHHSKVCKHEVLVTWNQKVGKRTEVEIALLSSPTSPTNSAFSYQGLCPESHFQVTSKILNVKISSFFSLISTIVAPLGEMFLTHGNVFFWDHFILVTVSFLSLFDELIDVSLCAMSTLASEVILSCISTSTTKSVK